MSKVFDNTFYTKLSENNVLDLIAEEYCQIGYDSGNINEEYLRKLVKLLPDKDVNISVPIIEDHDGTLIEWGHTILQCAIMCNHKDIIELLLKKENIDINASNGEGEKAIHVAIIKRDEDTVKLLIENNAELYHKSKYLWDELTALDLAKKLKLDSIVKIISDKQTEIN